MKKKIPFLWILIIIFMIAFTSCEHEAQETFIKNDNFIMTRKDLVGTFSSDNEGKTKNLKYSIKIIDEAVYFELKEKGRKVALASSQYNVKILADDIEKVYVGLTITNEEGIMDVVKVENLFPEFLNHDYITITISNPYSSYALGKIDTSEIASLIYNKLPYMEAIQLMETEDYEAAMGTLFAYWMNDRESAIFFDAEGKYMECHELCYKKAMSLYVKGEYSEAIKYFDICGASFKDSGEMIEECKKNLGIVRETIFFGKHSDGTPLEWDVLKKEGDKQLIISHCAFVSKRFKNADTEATWETSDVRYYLNSASVYGFLGEFFSEEEQSRILESKVINFNSGYSTILQSNLVGDVDFGNNTKDKVFLLSIDEVLEYFPTELERIGRYPDGDTCEWMLRSMYSTQRRVAVVSRNGSITSEMVNYYVRLRPAMWVTVE